MKALKIFVVLMVLSSPLFAHAVLQGGTVKSGDTPIVSATVTLYGTGRHHRHSAEVLGTARTDKDGYFKISNERPRHGKALLYLVAEGGSASDGHRER